jgi:hypothetical protein
MPIIGTSSPPLAAAGAEDPPPPFTFPKIYRNVGIHHQQEQRHLQMILHSCLCKFLPNLHYLQDNHLEDYPLTTELL